MLVRQKCVQKMSIFKPCQRRFHPCKWQWTGAVRGGRGVSREKLITFLLRGKMIFCYHVNRFLTVSRLSETVTYQISNFQGENCPKKNLNFWSKLPPWCPVAVSDRSQTNATVSSLIWSTNYTQSFVWPFPIRFQFLFVFICSATLM